MTAIEVHSLEDTGKVKKAANFLCCSSPYISQLRQVAPQRCLVWLQFQYCRILLWIFPFTQFIFQTLLKVLLLKFFLSLVNSSSLLLPLSNLFHYFGGRAKDYLALAKCKKRPAKKIKKAIGKQLRYIRRDMKYIDTFLACDTVKLTDKEIELLAVLKKVYEQQLYMFENNTHRVADRIVSISQPYIRPIVRGKAKSPVEFGAKLDLSVDENGMSKIEKLSFDAYNEAEVLKTAAEYYKNRTGHYPERILADQIYRNRDNRKFCSEHGIRLSGKPLGRPKSHPDIDKKTEYKDNTDRIEVERKFSLSKRKFGLGLLLTKREDTTRTAIALSVLAMNVDRLLATFLHFVSLYLKLIFFPVEFLRFSLGGGY